MAEVLQSLAALVEDLGSRTDTDHVLREICGQYALEKCTLAEQDLHHASIRFVAWFRLLLFGVYRATLGKPDSDTACMLPASALISGLLLILSVDESQCILGGPEVNWKTWKPSTFLLGLRLLRGSLEHDTYHADQQQLRTLSERLSQRFPSGDPRNTTDAYWLCHQLLHEAIDHAAENGWRMSIDQPRNSVSRISETLGHTTSFTQSRSNVGSNGQYWRHFDAVSETEATFFTKVSSDQFDKCHQYLHEALLRPFDSSEQPIHVHWRKSLAQTLVTPARFFPQPHQTRIDIDHRYNLDLDSHHSLRTNTHHHHSGLLDAAKSFHDFLSTRAQVLEHSSGSVHKKLNDIADKTGRWYLNNRYDHGTTTMIEDESDSIYVLNCPRLHLISRKGLMEYLGNVDARRQRLSLTSDAYVEWASSTCPSCHGRCNSARLVEPLQHIVQEADKLQSERLQHNGKIAGLLQSTSEASSAHTRVNSDDGSSFGSHRPSSSTGRRSSLQPSINTVSSHNNGFFEISKKFKYTFSTSGVHLILWKQTYGCFVTLDVYGSSDVYWELPPESSSNIRLVAGGSTVFCALAQDDDRTFTVHIFSQDQFKPSSFEIKRSTATEPFAMAVSPNDRSVAIGFGKSVAVCDVRTASWSSKHTLTGEDVWEQVINFSHDSRRVVVASRSGSQGSVSCTTWEISAPQDSRSNVQIGNWRKGQAGGDFGLRSVFYDHSRRHARVAVYLSHLALSPNAYLIGGSKSQCAAQSDNTFLLVSDGWTKYNHEVVELSATSTSGRGDSWFNLGALRGQKSAITKKEELPIIATARENKTVIFWISNGEMKLVRIQKQQPPKLESFTSRFQALAGSSLGRAV